LIRIRYFNANTFPSAESNKTKHKSKTGLYSCPYRCQMLTDFQNSFTSGLSSEHTITWSIKISPHFKVQTRRYTTLWNVNVKKQAIMF